MDGPALVYVVRAAAGEPRMLFRFEGGAVQGISWSATGNLYCTAHRGGTERWQVYVYRSGGQVEDVAGTEGDRVQHHLSHNGVSPDGRLVAISTNARQPEDVDVDIVDTQTVRQRPVVSGPTWHVVGGWSPDGRWLSVMRVAMNTDQDLLALDAARAGWRNSHRTKARCRTSLPGGLKTDACWRSPIETATSSIWKRSTFTAPSARFTTGPSGTSS